MQLKYSVVNNKKKCSFPLPCRDIYYDSCEIIYYMFLHIIYYSLLSKYTQENSKALNTENFEEQRTLSSCQLPESKHMYSDILFHNYQNTNGFNSEKNS